MEKFLTELLEKRNAEMKSLRDSLLTSENKEERKSILDSIASLENEIKGIETQLRSLNEPAANQPANAQGLQMRTVGGQIADNEDVYGSVAYRKAFMKAIVSGNRVDFRADQSTTTTDTNVNTVIPTNLVNQIIEKFEQLGKLYNLVTRTSYAVGQVIPTDGVKPVATWVSEGASSDSQKKTLGGTITFSHFKLRCEIRYSEEVNTMTLSAFEALFVKQVSEAMLRAIEGAIVDGDGSTKPKGILMETPNEGQAISVEASGKLTYKLLTEVEAAIPEQYEATTRWVMNKKTFMAFIGMVDSAGQPIARINYGIGGAVERTLLGREVVLYTPQTGSKLGTYSDTVTADTIFAFLADLGDYVLNTNYNLGIQNAVDWDNEDHKTKAVLACDGKMIVKDSLITLTKKKAAG